MGLLNSNRLLIALAAVIVLVGGGWYGFTYPLHRAVRAYEQGDWRLAAQAGTTYLDRQAKSQQARRIVAQSYVQLGRWSDAERYFAELPQPSREDMEARAMALGRLNRLSDAADLYQNVYEANPDDPQAMMQWAAALISLDRLDRAIELAHKLAEFPSHTRASDYLLGMAYYQKLEYARAVQYFDRLLDSDPQLIDPLTRRRVFWEDYGTALVRLGRLKEAQQHLERAAVLFQTPEIMDLLAQVHDQRRDRDRAERYWGQAIALDPGYLPALKAMARLALQRDDPDKSAEYLNRALDYAPNDVAIHTNLAAAYGRAGRSEQAAVHASWAHQLRQLQNLREQLAAQVRENPDGPEAQLLEAIQNIEERRLADAEVLLKSLLQQRPNFVPAQRLLEAVVALQ